MRRANQMMNTITPTATIDRIQVNPVANENAAPEFFTKWNCSNSPNTGTSCPTSRCVTIRNLAN